jgi:hypothetical protein
LITLLAASLLILTRQTLSEQQAAAGKRASATREPWQSIETATLASREHSAEMLMDFTTSRLVTQLLRTLLSNAKSLNATELRNFLEVAEPRSDIQAMQKPIAMDKEHLILIMKQRIWKSSTHPTFPDLSNGDGSVALTGTIILLEINSFMKLLKLDGLDLCSPLMILLFSIK